MAVLIVYWTSSGNTGMMADAIKEGVLSLGKQVEIRMVSDISASEAAKYDKIALGCPSMGIEQLEEYEFEPFYNELKPLLFGKKIVLFGSYSWGDGAWMRTWQDDARTTGAQVLTAGVIANETPDDVALEACRYLGEMLAKA